MTPSPSQGSSLRRVLWRLLVGLPVAACLLLAAAAAVNFLTVRHYRSAYPPPGRMYRVDGYAMHLFCVGSGSPTVVLESGLGDSFLSWGLIQPKLAQLTRVCSYDRAGLGFSDPRPGLRDSNAVVEELHALLQQADISGPFVLMGHSIAGLHMRVYAARYPQDLVGIVFVDPSTPEQYMAFLPEGEAFNAQALAGLRKEKWAAALGWSRLRGRCGVVPPGYDRWAGWIKAFDCDPSQDAAAEQEFLGFPDSREETSRTGTIGAVPVLILSSDPAVWGTEGIGVPESLRRRWAAAWNNLHEALKQRLSTRARRVVAKGSHHYVQNDRSALVLEETTRFIEEIRGTREAGAWGSTVTR